jgi:putative phosphoesterase
MQIAVFSDIHDNYTNLEKFFDAISKQKIDQLICLGDFINPGIVKRIIDSGYQTYAVWGNNEGEKMKITEFVMNSKGKFQLSSNTESILEIDGKKLYLNHYPEIPPYIAKTGDFDAVFYGHDHQEYYSKLDNGCILCNPGEISGHITGNITYAIWDTKTNTVVSCKL